MILGNNGYIWLSRTLTEDEKKEKEARDKEEDQSKVQGKVSCLGRVTFVSFMCVFLMSIFHGLLLSCPQAVSIFLLGTPFSFSAVQAAIPIDGAAREAISRVRNAIVCLSKRSVAIHPRTIQVLLLNLCLPSFFLPCLELVPQWTGCWLLFRLFPIRPSPLYE